MMRRGERRAYSKRKSYLFFGLEILLYLIVAYIVSLGGTFMEIGVLVFILLIAVSFGRLNKIIQRTNRHKRIFDDD
ncbi:MAG: hypothetical protein DSZ03_07395 [Sulfurimonas sp.]|nr:MAG: hypothetical protein DSZ03_07395 [Sulfurimonas sp.]